MLYQTWICLCPPTLSRGFAVPTKIYILMYPLESPFSRTHVQLIIAQAGTLTTVCVDPLPVAKKAALLIFDCVHMYQLVRQVKGKHL